MENSRSLQNLLLLSGMVGLLVLGLVFDLILQALVERNAQLGTLDTTLVWIFPLLQFLFMAAAIGLAWLMIVGGGYSRWISIVYLLVGLVILYYNPVLYTNERPDSLYVLVEYVSPGRMMFQAGGGVAALGLLSLWFWKSPLEAEAAEEDEEEVEEAAEAAWDEASALD